MPSRSRGVCARRGRAGRRRSPPRWTGRRPRPRRSQSPARPAHHAAPRPRPRTRHPRLEADLAYTMPDAVCRAEEPRSFTVTARRSKPDRRCIRGCRGLPGAPRCRRRRPVHPGCRVPLVGLTLCARDAGARHASDSTGASRSPMRSLRRPSVGHRSRSPPATAAWAITERMAVASCANGECSKAASPASCAVCASPAANAAIPEA